MMDAVNDVTAVTVEGKNGLTYQVHQSESGLHFLIDTFDGDRHIGGAYVSRFDWEKIIAAVAEVDAKRTVLAQATNIVNDRGPGD
jgi:hypothetical protein